MFKVLIATLVGLSAAAVGLGTALVIDGRADARLLEMQGHSEDAMSEAQARIATLEAELERVAAQLDAERERRRELAQNHRRRLERAIKRAGEEARSEAFDAGYSAGFDAGVARATGGGVIVDCPDGIGPGGGPCGWGE